MAPYTSTSSCLEEPYGALCSPLKPVPTLKAEPAVRGLRLEPGTVNGANGTGNNEAQEDPLNQHRT